MSDDLKWLIGIAVGQFAFLGSAILTAFYRLGQKMSSGDGKLHDRIDEVKRDYVRRDDFHQDMERIEKTLEKIDAKLDKALGRPGQP